MKATDTRTPIDLEPPDVEGVCHLGRSQEKRIAACGVEAVIQRHPYGLRFEGQGVCPVHDTPICPACRAIIEAWQNSGAWEGP